MSKLFSVFLLLLIASSSFAQSNLRKANKQYELYAFNLAIKSYLKVLERNPDNAEALGKLGDCYRHLNRMEEAAKWYDKAVKQPKTDNLFYLQYGHVLKSLGKYKEAKQWYMRYAQNYPVMGGQFAESCDFAVQRRGDVPNYNVQKEFLNTSSADFGPALRPDGQVVYASSRKDIRNKRSALESIPNNQLFKTNRDANNYLEAPQLLKSDFGAATNEAPVAYSADGKMVAITKNNFVEGTRQIPSSGLELSLYFAEATPNGDWKNVVAYPYNGTGYSTGFASFSKDGNAVYFASDRPDGFGGFDIYISYKVGNSWSAPENLGAAVNTQGNEITPFHDGTYLYFASDWHKGFGGFDVFVAGQTNGRWNQISNAGTGINSSRDDFGFVYDNPNNVGYLVSNRTNGKGLEDLYRVNRVGSSIADTPAVVAETNTENTTPPNMDASGSDVTPANINTTTIGSNQTALKIMDTATGLALSNVKIEFEACSHPSGYADQNGIFILEQGRIQGCTAILTKIGYASKNISLNSYALGRTGEIDVFLNKQGNAFSGSVADIISGFAVDGALVQATNTETRQTLESYTNTRGKYFLDLKPNTSYAFRFSKIGYKDLTLSLTTGGLTSSKVLETVKISPSNALVNSSPSSGTTITSEQPKPQENNTNSGTVVYKDQYAVQIAALSAGKSANISNYNSKVGNIGEVYEYAQDGRNKIRVGMYAARSEAAAAQKQLRAKGFSGAFIVTQTEKISTNVNTKPAPNTTTPPTEIAVSNSDYMVQIAAFKNAGSFDKQSVMDMGIVQEYPKGNLTAIVLSGYDSKEQAQRAVERARKRGYTGAYLVQQVNGALVKAK